MIQKIIILFFLISATCCNTQPKTPVDEKISPKVLNAPADSLSAEPYLFTDKNGLVYLSWIEKRKDKSFLKFSILNDKRWSIPRVIDSGANWFVNWADYPMLASDGENNMIAHILEKSSKSTYAYDVKILTSTDKGNTWGKPKILHDDGKESEHGFVSLIPYEDGYFISWLDGRNTILEKETSHDEDHGDMTIRAALVDKQGMKFGEWELDKRVCDCCQTSVAITANGPIVVYRDRSEDEIRDISIVRFENGKWTAPKIVFPDNWKIEGCPVNGPRVAAQGQNIAVAWFSSPANKAQVNIIFSEDAGVTFKSPIRIDEGKALGRVDIVMLDDKSVMVSWMEGALIKAARVHSDGKKEASIIIASSSESRSSGFPQMVKSGNVLIFAWTDDKEKTIKVTTIPL